MRTREIGSRSKELWLTKFEADASEISPKHIFTNEEGQQFCAMVDAQGKIIIFGNDITPAMGIDLTDLYHKLLECFQNGNRAELQSMLPWTLSPWEFQWLMVVLGMEVETLIYKKEQH